MHVSGGGRRGCSVASARRPGKPSRPGGRLRHGQTHVLMLYFARAASYRISGGCSCLRCGDVFGRPPSTPPAFRRCMCCRAGLLGDRGGGRGVVSIPAVGTCGRCWAAHQCDPASMPRGAHASRRGTRGPRRTGSSIGEDVACRAWREKRTPEPVVSRRAWGAVLCAH